MFKEKAVSSSPSPHLKSRPHARRVFKGCVGSPLAQIDPEVEPQKPSPQSDAERARNYRERERQKLEASPEHWNRVLAKKGLSVNAGMYVKNAPRGCGKISTGGRKSGEIDHMLGACAVKAKIGGKRVRRVGHGADVSIDRDEQRDTDAAEAPVLGFSTADPMHVLTGWLHHFRWQWDLDARERRENRRFLLERGIELPPSWRDEELRDGKNDQGVPCRKK
jgi:hypothetical protein